MRLNWFNYKFLPIDGYGRLGLHMVKALIRAGHDVRPHVTADLEQPAWFQRAQGIDFSNATLMLMPPHETRHIPGRNFLWTMHESLTLPDGWVEHCNTKAQWLIVPSPWLVDLYRDSGVKLPIDVVYGGIDPNECPILNFNGNASRPFTFGALADRGFRKGWDVVYSAFYKAFDHNNKDVRLILKCRPGSLPPALDFSYSSDQRLTIWRADVAEVADVYAQFDAFMFPSRCEGLGMPPLEAAACGVPTVVQRFSGTADHCDHWATPLDNYTLVESHMDQCGGLWAEPDEDEVIEAMRWLYNHQDEAKVKALNAAQWLRDNRTYDHSAAQLMDVMARHLGHRAPERAMPAPTDNRAAAANWAPILEQVKSSNGHGPKEAVR